MDVKKINLKHGLTVAIKKGENDKLLIDADPVLSKQELAEALLMTYFSLVQDDALAFMILVNKKGDKSQFLGSEAVSCQLASSMLRKVADTLEVMQSPPQKSYGRPLTDRLDLLIRQAVKSMGTYDPDVCLDVVEEQMTADEFKQAQAFLRWAYKGNHSFGPSNLRAVWDEFWQSKGQQKGG